MSSENDVEEHAFDENESKHEDEQLRALLSEGAPDFATTSALGDRALAGAARRRTRVRAALGGAGAVAVMGVGVLVVAPLGGWSGHGSRTYDLVVAGAPTSSSTPTPTSSAPAPSSSTPSSPVSCPALPTHVTVPAWVYSPKEKAVDRLMNELPSGHDTSFMGVGLTGIDYGTGTTFDPENAYNSTPIVVYRKPANDPTLERDAIDLAAPFKVVFHDTVLDSSEQWYLGHRIDQDRAYWQSQGVQYYGTALQENGTITISAADPAKAVAAFEQHYGYDGRVFVGDDVKLQTVPASCLPPIPTPPSGN